MAQPKLSQASIKELLSLGPILGLDATTDPYYVDGTLGTDMLNIVPNRIYKAYATIRGRVPILAPGGDQALTALGLSYIPGQVQPVIIAVWPDFGGFRFRLFGGTVGWNNNLVGYLIGSSPGSFRQYSTWTFYSDPSPSQNQTGFPTGRANQFKLINDSSVDVTNWQAYPPTTPPATSGSGGIGGSIWGHGYYWRYTYSNTILETSPSPPVGPFDISTQFSPPTTDQSGGTAPPPAPLLSTTPGGTLPARTEYYVITYVTITGETIASPESSVSVPANSVAVVTSPAGGGAVIEWRAYGSNISGEEFLQNFGSPNIPIGTNFTEPNAGIQVGLDVSFVVTPSTDPQINTINLYRIGGTLSQWLLVASTNNTSPIIDTLADAAVTGQTLVLHRDPPAAFAAIESHKERMWGFGYPAYTDYNGTLQPSAPCDLWYSNYVQPWGFDNTNQVIQLGAHSAGDVGVEIKSLSSMLIAFKAKTTWAVYGEAPDSFFPQKLFDVGCSSKASVVLAFGVCFWLSNQGVYMFDGATLTYISTDIKKILDSFSEADFSASAGMFDDRMYWLSFPTQGISLGYDTVGGKWWKSNMADTIYAYDYEGNTRGGGPNFSPSVDLVIGGFTSSNAPFGVVNEVEQWFAAETDRNAPINSMLASKIGSSDGVDGTLLARWVELNAFSLSPTDLVLVTVDPNPGFAVPPSITQAFNAGNIPKQLISLPPGVNGQEMQLTIASTTSDMLQLEGAAIYGWIRRVFNVFG